MVDASEGLLPCERLRMRVWHPQCWASYGLMAKLKLHFVMLLENAGPIPLVASKGSGKSGETRGFLPTSQRCRIKQNPRSPAVSRDNPGKAAFAGVRARARFGSLPFLFLYGALPLFLHRTYPSLCACRES
jgi:hypothetical protein